MKLLQICLEVSKSGTRQIAVIVAVAIAEDVGLLLINKKCRQAVINVLLFRRTEKE